MPLVTIIIPCLNEEQYIEKCLEGVRAFACPPGIETEIFVMDGSSADRTPEIVARIATADTRVRLRPNPGRTQPCAMNLALREAQGAWIMRLDAHSFYPPDYLALCLETAQRTGADNVGGLFITLPGGTSYGASLVQALTTHRFGVGNSGFRLGMGEGAADTVPYGFFRREVFDAVGLFDERLPGVEDYEFNRRILANGGRIWRNPLIHVHYHNQPSLYKFYRKQFVREGPGNAYLWYVAPYAFAVRHAITAAFVVGVFGGLLSLRFGPPLRWPYEFVMGLYALLAILSALQQARRFRRWSFALTLPPCFFLFHCSYGLGVLTGLGRLLLRLAPVQPLRQPWTGAGFLRWKPPAAK